MDNIIECRFITKEDLEIVMRWRMMPEIDKNMRTHPVLTMEKQLAWFQKLQEENNQYFWIIWEAMRPIGVINIQEIVWDGKIKSCSTGIYIAEKNHGGPGLFFELHWNLFDLVFDVLKLDEIHAEALLFNKAAILLNQRMWPDIKKKDDCYCYHITKEQWQDSREQKHYQRIVYEWRNNESRKI